MGFSSNYGCSDRRFANTPSPKRQRTLHYHNQRDTLDTTHPSIVIDPSPGPIVYTDSERKDTPDMTEQSNVVELDATCVKMYSRMMLSLIHI